MELDSAPQDEEIIQRVLKGEREAFASLVSLHGQRIFSMIYRQVGDVEVARELTQDVFARAFEKLSRFRFQAKFSTWLIRIALNTANSYFNSRRYREAQRTTQLNEKTGDIPGNLSATLEEERKLQRLREEVARLNEKYSAVVVLHYFECKSFKEIAYILQVPVGTVCSRINTAYKLLRKRLGELRE